MGRRGTETEFELTTIERLERLGYDHVHGEEVDRSREEVVLRDRLRAELARRYADLPEAALDEAVRRFARPEGVDPLRRNKTFHERITRGIELKVEFEDGRIEHRHVYAVDWEEPHREDVKAGVRAAVKRVLRSKGVQAGDFDRMVAHIMDQAEAMYRYFCMINRIPERQPSPTEQILG